MANIYERLLSTIIPQGKSRSSAPFPGIIHWCFSSSASVLSDPDCIESFPTEIENNENCMDMDTQDSCSILSNAGNDNGQSALVYNDNDNGLSDKMNIKQSIDHVKNSNLDPSNDTIDSCIQNDINTNNNEPSISNSNSNSMATSNDEPSNNNSNSNSLATSNEVPSNSLASSNKTSGSGSRVAKSTGARVKTQVSGSSSPPVRSSPQVQSQKVRGRHISDAAAVAALSSVSRSVSSSERRALQRVFSKK